MNTSIGRRSSRAFRSTLCAALLVLGSAGEIAAQSTPLERGPHAAGHPHDGRHGALHLRDCGGELRPRGGEPDLRRRDGARPSDLRGRRSAASAGWATGSSGSAGGRRARGTHTLELFVLGDDEDADGGAGGAGPLRDHASAAGAPSRQTRKGWPTRSCRVSTPRILPGAPCACGATAARSSRRRTGWRTSPTASPSRRRRGRNIGSTSKQFTAFAIMLQAERGLLSLDDDIREHIPELPKFDHTIQVKHLITHTSGLREFLNLLRMAGRRLDHGDWIDRSELIDIVQRQPALQNEPGAEWNYNNTAFGLAAVIVERTSGQDFHVYMQESVFGPLGMTGTMVRPSTRHIVPDMSEGYTPGPDGYRQIGDLGGAVGAGAIYSTIGDLQTWAENYANPSVGTRKGIDEMMTSLRAQRRRRNGLRVRAQRRRAGRPQAREPRGGGRARTARCSSTSPRSTPASPRRATTRSSTAPSPMNWRRPFFRDAMEEEEDAADESGEFDAEDFDPEAFDEFAGRYALDAAPNFILTFTREDDTFYTQATGQQRLEIVPHLRLDLPPPRGRGFRHLPAGSGGRRRGAHNAPERRQPRHPPRGRRGRGVGSDGGGSGGLRRALLQRGTGDVLRVHGGGRRSSPAPAQARPRGTRTRRRGSVFRAAACRSRSSGTATDRSSASMSPTVEPATFASGACADRKQVTGLAWVGQEKHGSPTVQPTIRRHSRWENSGLVSVVT